MRTNCVPKKAGKVMTTWATVEGLKNDPVSCTKLGSKGVYEERKKLMILEHNLFYIFTLLYRVFEKDLNDLNLVYFTY